ncbi:phosphatase PAP2 family protein [Halovivax gelatinilyticus]|uniref:phosphatase PAP2 family protein n=1 Tax=Halovivax gelatinilyticus TaxID=2961597 RepID=UPI0020CA882E|nr:phosphatase PAP2 family protein [Halovivax gelatinilyticus]
MSSRGIGEFGPLQEAIPEWLAVIIALCTQLGDIWFLALVITVFYWYGTPSRDAVAALGGVWLAGMGLYKGLKHIFEFPRPDEPLLDAELLPLGIQQLYELTAFAGGFGFPSGHAVNTTIVYFGLAHILTVSTRPRRYAVAAGLVTLVSFSRVALGVHYLVDVVVGVAVGLSLLYVVREFTTFRGPDSATVSLTFAVPFGVFYVVASNADIESVVILGAALGGFAGWQLILLGRELVDSPTPEAALRPVALRGGLASVALAPLVATFEYFPILSVYVAGGVAGLATAVAVTIPVLHHSRHASRVGEEIRFVLWLTAGAVAFVLTPANWRRGYAYVRESIRRRLD